MRLDRWDALQRAASADHGILGTLHHARGSDLVPVCFAIDGEAVAIPVDSVKPKRSMALGRVRNLERDPRATLLIEHWDARDWSRLWWVRLLLVRSTESPERTEGLERSLRDRYPQYAAAGFAALLTFRIDGVAGWAASAEPAAGGGG